MKKFLITGAGGDIGFGMGLIIRENFPNAYIVGTDMNQKSDDSKTFDKIVKVPAASDKNFINTFKKIAEGFDLIVPSVEQEIAEFIKHEKDLQNLPLAILPANLLNIFLSKSKTAQFLQENGFLSPKTTSLNNAQESDLPLIVKPDSGRGSQKLALVKTKEELQALKKSLNNENMIAQQIVGDPKKHEHTCAIIRLNGKTNTLVMQRTLINGTTNYIKTVDNPIINQMLQNFAQKINLNGALNVQLMFKNNKPYIFEVNPRFSGTLVMRHKLGFSDLLWYINYRFNNNELPNVKIEDGLVVERINGWHSYTVSTNN